MSKRTLVFIEVAATLIAVIVLAMVWGKKDTERPPQEATDVSSAPGMTRLSGWDLSFELPKGWVVVPEYRDGDTISKDTVVSPAMQSVSFQSTDMTVLRGGAIPPSIGPYTTKAAMLTVTRIAPYESLPADTENIRYGSIDYSRVKPEEDDQGTTYYYVGTRAVYVLHYWVSGVDFHGLEAALATLREEG